MGIEHRPYVGTWRLGNLKLVQVTPDCLVYINGELSLPGCPQCNGRIDLQKYITEVSVDAGTELGSASASFSLSVPVHAAESFGRDAQHSLAAGLEVHIYKRGYFPVAGLYKGLAEPTSTGNLSGGSPPTTTSSSSQPTASKGNAGDFSGSLASLKLDKFDPELYSKWDRRGFKGNLSGQQRDYTKIAMANAEVIEQYWRQKYPDAKVYISSHYRPPTPTSKGNHDTGAAMDFKVRYDNGRKTVPALQTWGSIKRLGKAGRIPDGGAGVYINLGPGGMTGATPQQAGKGTNPSFAPGASGNIHYDFRRHYGFKKGNQARQWIWLDFDGDGRDDIRDGETSKALRELRQRGMDDVADYYRGGWSNDSFLPEVGDDVPNMLQIVGAQGYGRAKGDKIPVASDTKSGSPASLEVQVGESLIERFGLQGKGVEDVLAYPYYHVFHGVVTQVSHSWSGGAFNISVSCSSMLHFWSYHRLRTHGSDARGDTNAWGHRFANQHPYSILWTLHHETMGFEAVTATWGQGATSVSNAKAVSSTTGNRLWKHAQEYWKRRFQSNETRLRLHGASGELYSAAQAAYLARLNNGELTKVLRRMHSGRDGSTIQSGGKDLLSKSKSLGLFNKNRNAGLDGVQPSRTRFEMRLPEQKAFVQNINEINEGGVLEGTYTSKQDIAQQVVTVTGWEFYQDVDGDFVFKPPMYNLDTSSSRVYRIEDIDIVSISFNEAEPQATYITGKNPYVRNEGGYGLENEWGFKSTYIDYRLVAKFGWRPADFETTYISSPKSLFYAAMSRMDVMNAKTMFTCSVTIPLRPEMRPGYPVYIPYVDAFYYCHSFSHSYSVGGQCTTSLQLVAKRGKFFAPGYLGGDGVESIDLGNTALPGRPLEVVGKDGKPRLAGFPNCVLALDPKGINPLTVPTGVSNKLDSPAALRNLLQRAEFMGLVKRVVQPDGSDKYVMSAPQHSDGGDTVQAAQVEFLFQDPKDSKTSSGRKQINLSKAAKSLAKARSAAESSKKALRSDIQKKQKALSKHRKRLASLKATDTAEKEKERTAIRKLEEDHAKLVAQAGEIQRAYERGLPPNATEGAKVLLSLMEQVGEQFQRNIPGFEDLSSTVALARLLSEKKAHFTTGSQPGSYRYYSASHPDPREQGQPRITYTQSETGDTILQAQSVLSEPTLTEGFIRRPRMLPGGKKPEAELGQVQVLNGINVLTPTKSRKGEIVPTSEIYEMVFSRQKVRTRRKVQVTHTKGSENPFGRGKKKLFKQLFTIKKSRSKVTDASTIQKVYAYRWVKLTDLLDKGVNAALTKDEELHGGDGKTASSMSPPSYVFPLTVMIRGNKVGTGDVVHTTYKLSGTTGTTVLKPKSSVRWTKQNFFEMAGEWLGEEFRVSAAGTRAWIKKIAASASISEPNIDKMLEAFDAAVVPELGLPPEKHKHGYTYKTVNVTLSSHSPVFPVSDSKGYEVVGSYRYGRGLDIDPDGAWGGLASMDPLSVLDPQTMREVLNHYIQDTPITVDTFVKDKKTGKIKRDKNGNPVKVKRRVSGSAARGPLERKVLTQLRQNYSDQQLLDMGLIESGGKPNLFHLNLANRFKSGQEGLGSLPIVNAAMTAGDINHQNDHRACGCRAAEASVQLETLGAKDFVSLDQKFTPEVQEASLVAQWQAYMAQVKAVGWRNTQDAFRGVAPDRGGGFSLRSTLDSFTEGVQSAQRRVGQASQALEAAGSVAAGAIETVFGTEEEDA